MNNRPILVFDLDDTIFETKSIGKHHVASILDGFKASIRSFCEEDEISSIMTDLWKYPFDHVSEKYDLSDTVKRQFADSVNSLEYEFDIKTFSDFDLVQNLELSKVLVTTGFKKLQLAKIKALNLEPIFDSVHIDEIDAPNRIFKKGIFEKLIESTGRGSEDFLVIGDNPSSEIIAGHELGMTTVQIAKFGQSRSAIANHHITDYQELIEILQMV